MVIVMVRYLRKRNQIGVWIKRKVRNKKVRISRKPYLYETRSISLTLENILSIIRSLMGGKKVIVNHQQEYLLINNSTMLGKLDAFSFYFILTIVRAYIWTPRKTWVRISSRKNNYRSSSQEIDFTIATSNAKTFVSARAPTHLKDVF